MFIGPLKRCLQELLNSTLNFTFNVVIFPSVFDVEVNIDYYKKTYWSQHDSHIYSIRLLSTLYQARVSFYFYCVPELFV